MTIKNINQM